ncbi:M48 family metalloprotease [Streptomyces sp. NPDC007945]|uniref:M48 family metalloprotease n=1 Tax=Streptomyces sp. NPDC007945 TaxID=3364797 RepID=UPI0036ECFB82
MTPLPPPSSSRGSGPAAGPFALPSGTTVRFVLLIAAVTAVTALTVNSVSAALVLDADLPRMAEYLDCLAAAADEAAARRAEDPSVFIPEPFEHGCHDPRGMADWVPGAATGLLLLVILGVYLALPPWRIARRRYRPLTGMPELSATLTGLVAETGVRARVTFLAEPLDPTIAALAFGRVGRRYVVLSGGLLALSAHDRAAFRAVVLHELAHIRNRDLDVGFLTLIVWRTCGPPVLAFAGLAFLLAPVLQGAAVVLVYAFAAQLGLLALLVTLLSRAVLRSRELYADARVCRWEGGSASLRRLFESQDRATAPQGPATGRGAVWGLLRAHPTPARRLAALEDDGALSHVGFWDLGAVGAVAAFVHQIVAQGPAGGGFRGGRLPEHLPVALAAGLLVTAAGTVVWRAVARGSALRVRAAGIGLGLGTGLVTVLRPSGLQMLATLGGKGISYVLPYAALLCLAGWALVRWLVTVADAWQPVAERARRPHVLSALVLALSAAGLTTTLAYLLSLPNLVVYAASFIAPEVPGALVLVGSTVYLLGDRLSTVLLPFLLTGASIPLLGAVLAGRRRDKGLGTGFGPPKPVARLVVRLGVPAAFAAAVLNLVLAVLDPFPEYAWLLLLALFGLAEVGAAVWATRDEAPLRLVRGLVAVLGCGLLGALGWIVLVKTLTSCLPGGMPCGPLPDVGQVRVAVLAMTLTAVPAWLTFAGVDALTTARRHRRPPPPVPGPLHRPW